MKRIIIDLDGTIARPKTDSYANCIPDFDMVDQIRAYRDMGFEIVIFTARNMLTHQGEIGKINVHTLPIVLDWLNRHEVPYDQVIVGKPWCGTNGFYVDDRAIRPDEFTNLSRMEIKRLLGENDAQS